MIKASVTVAELSTTQPINSMILNGQLNTNVNGINIQNGLATQINAKVSSIELNDSFRTPLKFSIIPAKL